MAVHHVIRHTIELILIVPAVIIFVVGGGIGFWVRGLTGRRSR